MYYYYCENLLPTPAEFVHRDKQPPKTVFYTHLVIMRSIPEWLQRVTANAKVATVLSWIPSSSVTVGSEGRHMKQC
jgi:hypothetical protein